MSVVCFSYLLSHDSDFKVNLNFILGATTEMNFSLSLTHNVMYAGISIK